MFRITRGHHVQHVHFPLPVIRDLDAEEEAADSRQSGPAAAEPERAADAHAERPEAAR